MGKTITEKILAVRDDLKLWKDIVMRNNIKPAS